MLTDGHISAAARRLAQTTAPSPLRRAAELRRAGVKVWDLGRGEPEFATPPHVVEAASAAMRAGETHYGDVAGLFELREAVAAKLQRDNHLAADPRSEILITNGTIEGLFLAMTALLNPGDEVLALAPAYPHYEGFVAFPGGKSIPIPCLGPDGQLQPTRESIEELITPRCRVLLLNSPHNPTGSVLPRGTLEMLADVADRHGLIIVTDEVYEAITFPPSAHLSIAALSPETRQRTVLVNSLSKTYAMTGWRLGYAVAPRPILRAMRDIHEKSCRMASSFVQRAGIAALLGPQECVEQMVKVYARRRDWIVKQLNGLPGIVCPPPHGTFYAFPKIAGLGITSDEFVRELLEDKHVLVFPGSYYGAAGDAHIRVSFAADDESLEAGLAAISEEVL
jgi:aspartate/methionine/tyrosine aminotransferase